MSCGRLSWPFCQLLRVRPKTWPGAGGGSCLKSGPAQQNPAQRAINLCRPRTGRQIYYHCWKDSASSRFSSYVCCSTGAFPQQPPFGAYKLARRTVARGIVDQRLLRRRTGAHQLRRDKADIKRHPAANMLHGGPTDTPANACRYH